MEAGDQLLHFITDKHEIENAVTDINCDVIETYKECCKVCFEHSISYEEFKLKIDSVVDYLHDELHTGHWNAIALSKRNAFSAATFLKAVIILKNNINTESLTEALKCIDMGILLGAPLERNPNLLTEAAKYLTNELPTKLTDKFNEMTGRKELCKEYCESNELAVKPTEHKVDETTGKRKLCKEYCEYNELKAVPVEEKSVPSLEHFYKFHLKPEKPLKIQDCMNHWPACKKWVDVNYLLKTAGGRTVPVEIGSQYSDENWSQKLMTLKEFIEKYYLEKTDDVGYLAQHNLLDQIPELKDDICMPEYCCTSRKFWQDDCDPEINAWFGPKGTVSSLHYDPKDNILAQVFGTKLVILFSPSDSECLYPYDSPLLVNTAQVDPVHPDLINYPKFKDATMYKCLLDAGEMLYIPPKWWHHITALEKSFSVNFWWP